jgi:hypothetical protein
LDASGNNAPGEYGGGGSGGSIMIQMLQPGRYTQIRRVNQVDIYNGK